MTRLVPFLLAVAACGHPGAPATVETPEPAPKPLDLEWSMTVEGDRLRIDYTVTNGTGHRIYLLDRLINGRDVKPEAVVVMNGDAPGVVAFARMYVPTPRYNSIATLPSVARPLEAGMTAEGTAYVPLPMRAWHNFSHEDPLKQPLTTGVLRVGYMLDHGPEGLSTMELEAGPVQYAARVDDELVLEGDFQPLPE